jgi:threonylcarbamoyladenosine tRNA methylthiotransferase MtaB
MKKAAFYTLGCKVNQYETEALSGLFRNAGYLIVDFSQAADVYVINTCTVTGMSARKSRQAIRRAKNANPDAIIVAAGCYAQTAPGEVAGIPEVNLVIGTNERSRIIEYVRRIESGEGRLNAVGDIMDARTFEELKVDAYTGHTRAFLKIQDGCSQYCAYCIIPYARGPIRSRDPANVTEEVRSLAGAGYKEIVLTGIHLASYGIDLKTTSLLDIIKKIHEIPGIERIRLGSIEPTTVTAEFVDTVSTLVKLCPHYHVSLQSGCDETLKRMNRKYTTGQYRKAISLLREYIDDVSITTDIMVGFPGETEEEFEKSCRFAEEISFSKIHVFKYSPRKGTPAAGFPGQVEPAVKEERSSRLISLSNEKTLEFNSMFAGRTFPVLVEREVRTKKGFVEGLTPNYIRVVFRGNNKLEGKIVDVRMDKAENDYMTGEMV